MKLIDLSHKINFKTKSYPSDPDLIIKKEKNISDHGSLLHSIKFGTHMGTHLDSPAHIIENGKTIDQFKLDSFIGSAVKVDIDSWKKVDQVKCIDGIIFETGWYKNFNHPEKFYGKKRPSIPIDLINVAIKLKIKFFGCDLPSIDMSGDKQKPIHNLLLQNDMIIYESLNNLKMIKNCKKFQFIGLPLPLDQIEGSPVRAIAIIND